MEQYILYLAIKDIIDSFNSGYRCSFNDFKLNTDDIAAIRIKGAEPVEYRSLSTGAYYGYSCRLQILLQGGLTNNSLLKLLSLSSKIRSTLINTSNVTYSTIPGIEDIEGQDITLPDGKVVGAKDIGLVLSSIGLLGETDSKGKDTQGRPQYSLNFKIYYSIYIKT